MQQGFLDTRSTKPIGLGIVIAAHAVVLTAIALAPPDAITRITYFPTKLINVAPDKTPPPPPPPTPRVKTEVPTSIDTLVKTVPLPQADPIILTPPRFYPLPQQTTQPYQPPKIEPVYVGPTMDPSGASRFQPDYPLSLVRAGIEGTATVRILIGVDGRVKQVEMVNATDPAFFEATKKQALRYWKFRAATSDGVATEAWRTMTVRFKIQQ